MRWSELVFELLSSGPPAAPEELAAVLLARGRHALEGGGPLESDRILAGVSPLNLLHAALHPGAKRLRSRLEEACASLEIGGGAAEIAERAIFELLDARDETLIRAIALRELGLEDLWHEAASRVKELDQMILSAPEALNAVSWHKLDAIAATPLSDSIWKSVPDADVPEPELKPEWVEPVSEDELAQVALGLADDVLERRVSLAIAADPALRARYDAILEDAEIFSQPPEIPLPVTRLLRGRVHDAVPVPQQLAASSRARPRYEEPGAEDEVFTFRDNSQLFAQRRGRGWVLFLYRRSPGDADRITGPGVEDAWTEGRLLGAECQPGEVEIRYNGEVHNLRLDEPA